jgi:hypothetical protein
VSISSSDQPAPDGDATQFHKFDWIAAIRHDEQLSDGLKYVLTHIALVYLKHGGNGLLYARQSTIADELNTDIRQVQRAYAAAKRLGYFVKVKRAARGRGLHAPDSYRLAIPDLPDNMSARSDLPDKPADLPDKSADLPDKSADLPDKSADLPDIANSLTSDSDTIKGGEQGIEQGGEEGTTPPPHSSEGNPPLASLAQSSNPYGQPLPVNHMGSSRVDPNRLVLRPLTWHEFISTGTGWGVPEEQPSRYCDKHPNDTDQPCIPCKRQGELLRNWESAHEQCREYNEFVREEISNCEYCRDSDGKYIDESGQLWWCEHTEGTSRRHETC